MQPRLISHITHNILRPGLAALVLLLLCLPLSAQTTDPNLAQYWEMTTYYNPAATGSTDYLRIRGDARLQWLGIDNAPKDFLLTGDIPIKISRQRVGAGVTINQESIGLFRNLAVGLQASYKLKLFKGVLSVGLEGLYYNQKFSGSEVVLPDDDDYHDSTDEAIPTQDVTGSKFDFSAGLWYTHSNWWVGISGRHLLQPTLNLKVEGTDDTSSDTEYYQTELSRTLYFMGGGNIPIKNTLFELQPSVYVATDLTDYTWQADLRARYHKFLSIGVGYRWKSAVKALLAAEYKNFYLGYAYEYPLNSVVKASSGSHEIVAGYQLKLDFSQKNRNRHRSIRIM